MAEVPHDDMSPMVHSTSTGSVDSNPGSMASDGIPSPLDIKPSLADLQLHQKNVHHQSNGMNMSYDHMSHRPHDIIGNQGINLSQEATLPHLSEAQIAEQEKKRPKCKSDKTCGVCGDKALGYNFDAITCESCKAFFRRNALKDKTLKCLFNEKCIISVHTRRFCSYCRLMKCLGIGMRKDMILDDSERKKRIQKVLENRQKRKISPDSLSGDDMSPSAPTPDSSVRHHEIEDMPQDASATTRQLTKAEMALIEKLENLYISTIAYTSDEPEVDPNLNLNQLINNTGWIVRKFIKFSKKLEDFMKLKQETQIALLKGCTLICVFLRSIYIYDMDKNSWITPKCETPADILKGATGHVMKQLYEEHVHLSKKVKPLLGKDAKLYGILQILTLFSPEFPLSSEVTSAYISNIQDRYLTLLKHYLEATHSYTDACKIYPEILQVIAELKMYSDRHGQILLHVNTQQIEPILLEIFDLKV